jgi:hypothetical protein
MLESAGLGEMRLLRELEKRLGAMETHFYQDQVVADCEDNGTRMRATDLLADLLGKRKAEVAISGHLDFNVADTSPAERAQWIEDHMHAITKLLQARGWKPPDDPS